MQIIILDYGDGSTNIVDAPKDCDPEEFIESLQGFNINNCSWMEFNESMFYKYDGSDYKNISISED